MTRLAEESKANKTASEASAADPHTIESILRLFKFIPEVRVVSVHLLLV